MRYVRTISPTSTFTLCLYTGRGQSFVESALRTISPRHRRNGPRCGPCKRHGFTLVEVLAAVMLVGIILPAAMRGVSVATHAASAARHRNEASALGQSKLDEIVATQEYATNSTMSGDFGPSWPGYTWNLQTQDWNPNGSPPTNFTGTSVEELDLHVTWVDRNQSQEMVLSTLVYQSPYANSASTSQ